MHGVARPQLPTRSSVTGLDRRRLGPLPVLAQSVAAVAPSGAAAIIPAIVLGATGPGALLAFVCTTVVCMLVSWCIQQFACRMRAPGGLYSYSARALHPGAALVTGWSALLGYAVVAMAGLLAVGLYLSDLAQRLGAPPWIGPPLAAGLVLVAGIAVGVILVAGIRLSARVTLLVETVSILLVLVVLIVLLVIVLPTADLSASFAWKPDIRPLAVGIVIAISAFIGFESATTLSVEAAKPLESVPRAVRWTVPAAGVLYVFSSLVQSISMPGPTISHEVTPVTELVSLHEPTVMSIVLDLAIAASWFSCALASLNALVRVLFCMGREGVLPRGLGHTHPRYRTPSRALAAVLPPVVATPCVLILAGAQQHALADLLTLSALGYLGTYVVVCVATPLFLHRIGEATRASWIVSGAAGLLLSVIIAIAIAQTFSEQPVLVSVFLAVLFGSGCLALFFRLHAPARLAAVGVYDETIASDVSRGAQRGIFR
jgi:amino acid transporter